MEKVANEALLEAGLELMRQNARPLTRRPTKGTAKIFATPTGESVRVRTCNDHLLVVLADRDGEDARLNIEGTDHVLIVMPETPRTHGAVMAFLVPAAVVGEAARTTHREWLASNPNTKGDNRTWNLWFDESGPEKANGFARKWAKYRLSGTADTPPSSVAVPLKASAVKPLSISEAKMGLALTFGVPPEAIEITIRG